MDTLLQDLRYALRQLAKSPVFTAVVITTLALGIGATTAVFGVLDRAVLRPLPVSDPDRLVHIVIARPGSSGAPGDININANLSYPGYKDLEERTNVFAGVMAHVPAQLALGAGGQTQRIDAAGVSGGFFTTLGLPLELGRDILPREDQAGAPQSVVVLGHALWQRQFGADRAILGSSITLNGHPHTVIGVASAQFAGLTRGGVTEAWVPVTTITSAGQDAFTRRTVSWLDVFARLGAGVSAAQARAALLVLDRQLEAAALVPPRNHLVIRDGSHGLDGLVSDLARPLAVVMAAVTLLLIVACANVAGLLLVRATARRREMAIRLSIGAGRRRLVRQLVTESAVLAAASGAAGFVVAVWLAGLIPAVPTLLGAPLAIERGLDARLLLFGGLVTICTAVGFGLVPAWHASRTDLVSGLKDSAAPERRHRLHSRDGLVVLQVAVSFVLMVGAGLLVRTARTLGAIDPGYDPSNVLLVGVDLDPKGYDGAATLSFWNQLLERIRGSPGVTAASLALTMVPSPGGMSWGGVPLEGFADTNSVEFDANVVGTSYFETMRIPVTAGRGFDARDRFGAPRTAVINEAMAHRYWPSQSALGRRIGSLADGATIVGVVRDGKYRSLRETSKPVAYLSGAQDPVTTGTLIVRTRIAPLAMVNAVRREIHAVDPDVPVFDVHTLDNHLALASGREHLVAAVSVLFGMLALVLSVVGLAGLLAFAVTRRMREIGVRLALGARPRAVLLMVLRRGVVLLAVGVAVGLVLAVALGRFAIGLLYGVTPTDLASFGAAALLLTAGAALGSYFPARRATRVDPVVALRTE
jgi:putative ABC transport system permease protein